MLKARALANLVFSPGQIQGISFDGVTPILAMSVLVQNASSVGVSIESMAGNIFTQDGPSSTLIGNISAFQPVIIQPNGSTLLVLNVRMRVLGIVNEVIEAFQNKNFTKTLEFQCTVNVHGVQMPLNFQIAVGA